MHDQDSILRDKYSKNVRRDPGSTEGPSKRAPLKVGARTLKSLTISASQRRPGHSETKAACNTQV